MEDHSDIQPSSHFQPTSILEELPGDLSDRFRDTMEDEIQKFRQSMEKRINTYRSVKSRGEYYDDSLKFEYKDPKQ